MAQLYLSTLKILLSQLATLDRGFIGGCLNIDEKSDDAFHAALTRSKIGLTAELSQAVMDKRTWKQPRCIDLESSASGKIDQHDAVIRMYKANQLLKLICNSIS